MTQVTVRIHNAYEDGYESTREVVVAAPGDDLEGWWQEVVWPHTGDGHGADNDLGCCYTAEIVKAGLPDLVGLGEEWC